MGESGGFQKAGRQSSAVFIGHKAVLYGQQFHECHHHIHRLRTDSGHHDFVSGGVRRCPADGFRRNNRISRNPYTEIKRNILRCESLRPVLFYFRKTDSRRYGRLFPMQSDSLSSLLSYTSPYPLSFSGSVSFPSASSSNSQSQSPHGSSSSSTLVLSYSAIS